MKSTTYLKLKSELINRGFGNEIKWTENLKPCKSAKDFFIEYMWVVVNSGMKNQIAEKIFGRIIRAMEKGILPSHVFGHLGKTKAIEQVLIDREKIFKVYQKSSDKLSFLESLPWIGKITKYHLARNLGLDFCKPDRHLVRIARSYNMKPEELCRELASRTGDRIGTIDVVLWRSANLGLLPIEQNSQLELIKYA